MLSKLLGLHNFKVVGLIPASRQICEIFYCSGLI